MKSYKIASIAGDGIGKEVLPESLKVLKETAKKHQQVQKNSQTNNKQFIIENSKSKLIN